VWVFGVVALAYVLIGGYLLGFGLLDDRKDDNQPTKIKRETPKPVVVEVVTEAPTQAPTECVTEVVTEAPTEQINRPLNCCVSETPTKSRRTPKPIVVATEMPTEIVTEAPTPIPTEAPTEEVTPAPKSRRFKRGQADTVILR
jgi:hypothetical protein